MANLLLKARLALELPKINAALERAENTLPPPARPVAHHIFSAGGKRIRPLLTVLVAGLLGYGQQNVYDLACSVEMLHAATLLHDDVLDNALLRRGKPAAHTVFSVTQTILAGDALLAAGNAIVAGFDSPGLSLCFSAATSETCAGEIMEIASQRNPGLSMDDYLAIIRGKTAKLISCACEMGARLAGGTEGQIRAAARYGENVGFAFQIIDDALDFAPAAETGKPCDGDLREGKLTLPLRCYRDALPAEERTAFDRAFSEGTFTDDDVAALAARLHARGFVETARRVAGDYLEQALSAVRDLPDGPEASLLTAMAEYIRDRKK